MVNRVAIVGAGTMGAGIAQVFAQAGYPVTLIDIVAEQLGRAMDAIRWGTERLVAEGSIDEAQREALLGRISVAAELDAAHGSDLAIEAVVERYEAKRDVLGRLGEVVGRNAILASNTSSLSITRLGACTQDPARFVGMHFVNPVPVMALVEVIRGLATSDETHDAVMTLAARLGKTPLSVSDSPGFALNRLLIPMLNEAAYLLLEGTASAEDIDAVMKLGANHPMGPLALADLIGLDTCLAIMEVLHSQLGDDKYRPCPLLRQMVSAGRLGRKSGRGFHSYDVA